MSRIVTLATTANNNRIDLDNELLIQRNSITTRIAVLEIMSKNGWSSNISLTQKIDAISHSLSCTSSEFQKILFKNLYEAYARRNGEFYPEAFPVSQMNDKTVIEKEFNKCTESFNEKCHIEKDTVNNSEFAVVAEQVDLLDAEIEMGSPIKNQTKIQKVLFEPPYWLNRLLVKPSCYFNVIAHRFFKMLILVSHWC